MNEIKSGESLTPKTTLQEDMTVAGQRRINMIWEITQALIALGITVAIIYTALSGRSVQEIISNAFFLIVGFYFSRTNHSAIGSIGSKSTDNQPYLGR